MEVDLNVAEPLYILCPCICYCVLVLLYFQHPYLLINTFYILKLNKLTH